MARHKHSIETKDMVRGVVTVICTTKVVVENISMARMYMVISCMTRVVVMSCWHRLVWLQAAVVNISKIYKTGLAWGIKLMPHKTLN